MKGVKYSLDRLSMMQIISEKQLIEKIRETEPIHALIDNQSLEIKIEEYVPYICTAIHAGTQLRNELQPLCLLSEKQRMIEEDIYTDLFINPFPVTIIANDSRYEYDLNRSVDTCIYDNAWGKKVWKKSLTKAQRRQSQDKHQIYYRILSALVDAIYERFGFCLIIDVHSYNWKVRPHIYAPTFNIGTKYIDKRRYASFIENLLNSLRQIQLPNIETTADLDIVFLGAGHQAQYIQESYRNNVVNIALEIKKIYMDEEKGTKFPMVIEALQHGLYKSVLDTAAKFSSKKSKASFNRANLISQGLEPLLKQVDKTLFKLSHDVQTLYYLNPINLQSERKLFFRRKHYEPQFKYRQLLIDPYQFKERLFKLPVSDISNPPIREMYQATVNALVTKIELLTSIGTRNFLYNSLRYYGEPSPQDIANANFLLHVRDVEVAPEKDYKAVGVNTALEMMSQAAKEMGLNCKIVTSNRIIAKAMVNNKRKTLYLNSHAKFSPFEVSSLIHHELGVHMVTTLNALKQPLNILRLGLPGNTYTQEGLAILAEFLTNSIDLSRLKKLSLRVLAVDMMVKGMTFIQVYNELTQKYGLSNDEGFTMTTRVFRGGGFTKDYLYLKGFSQLLKLYQQRDITNLFLGKTSLHYIDTLDEMITHKQLNHPTFLSPVLAPESRQKNPILQYIVSCITY